MDGKKTFAGKHLIVIAGPTAVGKTEVGVRLAQHLRTDILSADSRQFFKEMAIGTAKPSLSEQQGVRHHFVHSHSIAQDYSAGTFEQDALHLLDQLFQAHDQVVLVGGSGLYVRAVCEGMDEMPEVDSTVRESLNRIREEKGLPHLLALLEQHDPAYLRVVDQANVQRVVRALEVSLSSGQPYSSFRQHKANARPFGTIKIGLNRDRAELYERIDRRVDQMLERGLREEAASLYPFRSHNALQTVGYREIFGFLEGQYPWEEAIRLLKRNSRRYAKRQLTWFHKDPEYTWFHPDDWEQLLAHVEGKKAGQE